MRTASGSAGRIFGARQDETLSAALSELHICELPLHVLVDRRSKQRASGGIVTHLCEHPLPEGSFCRIDHNVFVSSPEATLVQLAPSLPYADLLELMLEFCGGYAIDDASERGFQERPALTSAAQLETFVRRMGGRRGAKAIRPLLRYVVDDSASPMESIVLMLLCLPSKLGGYQLPIPQHNVEIPITERARSQTKRKSLVCDLYWWEFHLDVECDSTLYHSSKEQLGIDSDRRIILDAMGHQYVGITRWQLEHDEDFLNAVLAIRRAMGLKLRNAPEAIQKKRVALREYLVTPQGSRPALVIDRSYRKHDTRSS